MALAGGHTLGHSGGAHEMWMSPGSTWLPLVLSTTWSSWAGNTVKKGCNCQGYTLRRYRRTMWFGPPQPHIALNSINVHNAEDFQRTFLCVLWVAWFFVTGLMSNGRTLFMCRRKKCLHKHWVLTQREAGSQGRNHPAQQKPDLLPKELMAC